MSALHGLELCRHFEVTDRKDCIELCPVSMEEGGVKTPWEKGLSLRKRAGREKRIPHLVL